MRKRLLFAWMRFASTPSERTSESPKVIIILHKRKAVTSATEVINTWPFIKKVNETKQKAPLLAQVFCLCGTKCVQGGEYQQHDYYC